MKISKKSYKNPQTKPKMNKNPKHPLPKKRPNNNKKERFSHYSAYQSSCTVNMLLESQKEAYERPSAFLFVPSPVRWSFSCVQTLSVTMSVAARQSNTCSEIYHLSSLMHSLPLDSVAHLHSPCMYPGTGTTKEKASLVREWVSSDLCSKGGFER